ncbi:MAG TPA: cupin domain-containing protein [Pyrinomonadaceae bacterium]|jgi:quercetin dioxygenase-like cupin family protein|nr:cupin domain-containing protein [Pyrinomonadaceae bacterium]
MSSARHGETVLVRGSQAASGERGEKLLVNGERMAMRLWEREPAGTPKPEHSNPYEYVAYVVEGALRVTIDGHSFEARRGDSYCVPANAKYTLEILEEATVVEATSPSDRGANTFDE